MAEMTAFERQLASRLEHFAGPEPLVDVNASVRAARTTASRTRFQTMFSATKFAVAGVVVALFAGVLLAAVLTQQNETSQPVPAVVGSASPEASSTIPFKLPAVVPEGVESGTIETSAGAARWVHIEGNSDTLPVLVDVERAITWHSGIAVFQPTSLVVNMEPGSESHARAIERPSRLWVSADGVDWRLDPHPVPDDAYDASLTRIGDTFWLVANVWSGDRLWRSSDGLDWEEFDPSGLAPPGPVGFTWQTEYSAPVTAGGLTFMSVSASGSFPFDDLPSSAGCREWQKLREGVYQARPYEGPALVGDGCGRNDPILRFTETSIGLEVSNEETGEKLGEIRGADLIHLDAISRSNDPTAPLYGERVLIIGEGEVTPVDAPWPGQHNEVTLFGTEGGIYAYVYGGCCEDSEMSAWHTSDGHSWSQLETPSFLEGAPPSALTVFAALPGSLAVSVFEVSGDGVGPEVAWETADGVSWSQVGPEGRPDGAHASRLESGWFASDGDFGGPLWGDELWVYIDDTWVSLAEMGMEQPREGCIVFKRAVGNTTLFGSGGCQSYRQVRDLWVLTVEPAM